ncbi:kinase-like domain-containing protein [Rhizophagus irregularis DAOM 181602=DAOM 197198]|nr:kinase-like domain-containing protein [Rhizophagus irregularis DAOM 181602=DAOM 197198]
MRKLWSLRSIAVGLEVIHKKGLIHHDFYCGNILSDFVEYSFITDLGLCQPANETNILKKVIFMDMGSIAYEICTSFPPYYDIVHDEILAMKICKWLRPKSNYKIPQLILDIINQCWDADPLKRPKADELGNLFTRLWSYCDKSDSLISEQAKEADEINKKSSSTVQSPLSSTSTLSYITHPQAVYTSRLLNFKNLPEPKNSNNDDLEYSDSLRMSFTKLDINSKDKSS